MPRNISKPFNMTLSLIDIEPLKPKYKCFFGEDVQLNITVTDENRQPLDLSQMSARVYYICDGVDLRQDDNITITDTMRGRLKVIVKRNYIRVGINDVRVVLYDNDQEIMLQPATILCKATDISDVNPPPEDPAFDYKTEILKVKNTSINNQTNIGDISTLKTTVKSDLVAGINELKDSIETNTSQLEQKAEKIYVDTKIGNMGNTKTFKGSCLYSALPISATVDDYWYVTDKTTNYCWNGTSWVDIGNNLNIGLKTISQDKLDSIYKKAKTKTIKSSFTTLEDIEPNSISYVEAENLTSVFTFAKNIQTFSFNSIDTGLKNVVQTEDTITSTVLAGKSYTTIKMKPVYLKAGTYAIHREFTILSGTGTGNIGFAYLYKSDGTVNTGSPLASISSDNVTTTYTVTEEGYYMLILYPNLNGIVTSDISIKFFNVQIEKESFSSYEKFKGDVQTGTNFVFNTFENMTIYSSSNTPMMITYPIKENVDTSELAERVEELEKPSSKIIDCFGDSLTQGIGGSGNSYPLALKNKLGEEWQVNNYGVGGENTFAISGRQGGIPLMVLPVTIPNESVEVEISLISISEETHNLGSTLAGVNPCYINGIEGTLVKRDGKYYFTRTTKGDSVILTNPTILVTDVMKKNNNKNVIIIWMGTNGSWWDTSQSISSQWLCSQIKNMIDFSNSNNYLVIGLTSQPTDTQKVIDKEMRRQFGSKFIQLRKHLIEYGLVDAGITPTEQDTTDIVNGIVPTSLRSDTVHLNSIGYTVVGNLIYKHGKGLGYW